MITTIETGTKTASVVLAAATFTLSAIGAVLWHRRRTRTQVRGHIAKIIIYPIKSCHGISVQMAKCTPQGLQHGILRDRSFMIVDSEAGKFISLAENPTTVLIKPSVRPEHPEVIWVEAPGMETLRIDIDDLADGDKQKKLIEIESNGFRMSGYDCGDKPAEWFQKFLKNTNLRLVYLSSDLPQIKGNQKKGFGKLMKDKDVIPYSFTSAFTVNSESSHEDLNKRLNDPMPITNFRPNITVGGSVPYEEDEWNVVALGEEVIMQMRKLCQRCVYVNVNADNATKDPDVLKTLLRYRKCWDENLNKIKGHATAIMGLNVGLERQGTITVGDAVHVTYK